MATDPPFFGNSSSIPLISQYLGISAAKHALFLLLMFFESLEPLQEGGQTYEEKDGIDSHLQW
jgi:hypothetical protein